MSSTFNIYLNTATAGPSVCPHFAGTDMTALLAASLSLLMIGTAFLSGIFGMAGGLILVGGLLFLFPLPTAMGLHVGKQMASNGWRSAFWGRELPLAPTRGFVLGVLSSSGAWF